MNFLRSSSTVVQHRLRWTAVLLIIGAFPYAVADERRAAPPKFSESDTRGVFFPKLSDAIRGERPSLANLRKAGPAATQAANVAAQQQPDAGSGAWDKLISPASLEDEVKRVKLHFDSVVTTPGAFKSGGYQDARLDLSILAVMFAVINDYGGDVRWKEQAAAARDLLARSAFNCKAGSTQVYNEAKLRKGDLQELVGGSGLTGRDAEAANDWSSIVDRSPMMEYAEQLSDSLQSVTNNEASVKSNTEQVRREAELLAILGLVLVQEGMDEYDDEDYAAHSKKMTSASREVVAALERGDADAIRKSVGAITQSCDACHEDYR